MSRSTAICAIVVLSRGLVNTLGFLCVSRRLAPAWAGAKNLPARRAVRFGKCARAAPGKLLRCALHAAAAVGFEIPCVVSRSLAEAPALAAAFDSTGVSRCHCRRARDQR